MKLRPLDNGVVIKQSEAEKKTQGGIILPGAAQEKPQTRPPRISSDSPLYQGES